MAKTWLSSEAYNNLQEELEKLRTQERPRIADTIEEARAQGDIRENAAYDAAKEEQGQLEARIRQLEQLLRNARVGEPPPTDTVAPGTVVTIEVEGDEETYLVGSREERHRGDYEVLSASSPLGKALLGARAGDEVVAKAPAGTYRARVRSIAPA